MRSLRPREDESTTRFTTKSSFASILQSGVSLGDSLISDREMLRSHAVAILGNGFRELSACSSLANTQASVGVYRHAGGHLAFEGVRYCSRTWVCPICSRIVIRIRQRQLLGLWSTVQADGYRPAVFCLTAGFPNGMAVAERLKRLMSALRRMTSGRSNFRQRWMTDGCLGFCRTIELNFDIHEEVWRPHLHGVAFFSGPVPPQFRSWLMEKWKQALHKEGLHGGEGVTVDDEFDDEKAAVAYTCKPIKDDETDNANLSPFQVLRASMTGEVKYILAFREYAEATKGLHHFQPSPGLLEGLEYLRSSSGVTQRKGVLLDMLDPQEYETLHEHHQIGLFLLGLHKGLKQNR